MKKVHKCLRRLYWRVYVFIEHFPKSLIIPLKLRFGRRYKKVKVLRFQIGDIVKVIYDKDVTGKGLGVKGKMGIIQDVDASSICQYDVKFATGTLPAFYDVWSFSDNYLKPVWLRRGKNRD